MQWTARRMNKADMKRLINGQNTPDFFFSPHLWQSLPMPSIGWSTPVEDSPCVRKNRTGLYLANAYKHKTLICHIFIQQIKNMAFLIQCRVTYCYGITCSISLFVKNLPAEVTMVFTLAPVTHEEFIDWVWVKMIYLKFINNE